MSPSARQIEREVEASRATLEETVEALKEKMTLGQMVDEASRYFSESGGAHLFSNLGAQVRDNPLPLALVGIGLAWLMSGRGRPHVRSAFGAHAYGAGSERDLSFPGGDGEFPSGRGSGAYLYEDASHPDFARRSGSSDAWSETEDDAGSSSMADKAGDALHATRRAVHDATDAVSGAAGSVASSIGAAVTGVGSAAAQAGRAVASGARGAGHAGSAAASGAYDLGQGAYRGASHLGQGAYRGASHLGDRARRGVADVLEAEPLILGALGLAVGAAIGAMLPRTETEDRYLGETRDRLLDEAESLARDTYEQGKAVAAETYEAAKAEAGARGILGGDEGLATKVAEVARTAIDTAKQKAEEKGLMPGESKPASEARPAGGARAPV